MPIDNVVKENKNKKKALIPVDCDGWVVVCTNKDGLPVYEKNVKLNVTEVGV